MGHLFLNRTRNEIIFFFLLFHFVNLPLWSRNIRFREKTVYTLHRNILETRNANSVVPLLGTTFVCVWFKKPVFTYVFKKYLRLTRLYFWIQHVKNQIQTVELNENFNASHNLYPGPPIIFDYLSKRANSSRPIASGC